MLVALGKDCRGRVEAQTAEREAPHLCPGCSEPVILKRGLLRAAHFAHPAKRACAVYPREGQAHLSAKAAFLAAFRERGLTCDAEVEVLSGEGDRRADILVRSPTGRSVAIELQHSMLTLASIEARTSAYLAAGVPVAWVAILDPRRLEKPRRVVGLNVVRVARYRAPAWQRWVRGYHMLGPWFYEPVAGVLWRGRFSPVSLWRGEHSPDGAGGADWRATQRYRSEAFRVLDLEGPYPLAAVRIDVVERRQSEVGAYRFPEGAMARLVVEGEPAGQTPPPLPLRSILARRVAGARRTSAHRLEVCQNGEWLPATLKPVELSKL